MGVFDTLIDGERSAQVKCWRNLSCKVFRKGEKVPKKGTYTIVLYQDSGGFALVQDGIFIGFTDKAHETYSPFISKWGKKLKEPVSPKSPIEEYLETVGLVDNVYNNQVKLVRVVCQNLAGEILQGEKLQDIVIYHLGLMKNELMEALTNG